VNLDWLWAVDFPVWNKIAAPGDTTLIPTSGFQLIVLQNVQNAAIAHCGGGATYSPLFSGITRLEIRIDRLL
jgi:hypothetical protein